MAEANKPAKKTSKLKLTLNIGTNDRKSLGLENGAEGEVVEVDEESAAKLIKRGWAAPIAEPARQAK